MIQSTTSSIHTTVSSSSIQQSLTNYYRLPIIWKEQPRFENLCLRIIVSNGLPFTFFENEDTQALFNFISSGITLLKHKTIGRRLLINSAKSVQKEVIKAAQFDSDGVTATFDGWTNVKQENIWGIVLITSQGQTLIWGAHEISSEWSRTADIIRHIENLIIETKEKNINIKVFISDSAREYAVAQ